MIDYNKQIVSNLSAIGIPVHYEMTLHAGLETPCISYLELTNVAENTGDTLGYSRLQFQIKVWSCKVADLQKYALLIDASLRPLGFKRVGSNEIFDSNSAMIQKILTYEALALEEF